MSVSNKSASYVFISGDELVLDFPYDKNLVAEIKTIKGAKWDKLAKVWRAPMTAISQIRDFANANNMVVDVEILRFDAPEHPNEAFGLKVEGEWVFLGFNYDPVKVRSVKSLPGVTWDAKTMAWKVPMTAISEAIRWADKFGEPVSEEARKISDSITTEKNKRSEESRATDAEINIPTIRGELLPYQRAGVAYALRSKRTFIADEMGLGKTIQAIASIEANADAGNQTFPVVIVCPPTLVLNWKKEIEKWTDGRKVDVVVNRRVFPEKGSYDYLVIGYSNISHWEKELKGHSSYIFDESHYAKTPTAQRTKSAVKIAKTAKKSGMVICLTGTPITNKPAEYASQLNILGELDKFGGLWGFYRRYCGAFRDRFGQWHIDGATNLEELNELLRSTCYIRRTKTQVMSELPEVRHAPVYVDIDDKSLAEYNKAKDDIVKYVMERAREIAKEIGAPVGSAAVRAKFRAEANEHLVRISVLRKLAAKAKMKHVEEIVSGMIESGKKVVIAAHHREIVSSIADKYGGLKIQGGMTVEEVEEHKRRFQEEDVESAPAIVLSIQAAKTGHTLTASADVVFVELPWTPADVDQTYSRCHRIGQKNSVNSIYILAVNTIDEEIYNLIERKRSVVNVATDGAGAEHGNSASTDDIVLSLFDSALSGMG